MKKIWLLSFAIFSFITLAVQLNAMVKEYTQLDITGEYYSVFVEGDFNQDGKMDYVASRFNETAVFLNDGDLTFTKVVVSTNGVFQVNSDRIQVIDYDNDGDLDIVYTYYDDIFYVENNGDETFEPSTVLFSSTTRAFEIVDIDSDGKLEIFMASDNVPIIYGVKQDTNGFTALDGGSVNGANVMYNSTSVNLIKAIDINHDGLLDLVFANSNKEIRYILNEDIQGDNVSHVLATFDNAIVDFHLIDIESDDDMDLLVATKYSVSAPNILHLLINNDGVWDAPYGYLDPTNNMVKTRGNIGEVLSFRVENVNGDLKPTIFLGVTASSSYGLYIFNQYGTASNPIPSWQKSKNQSGNYILIGDFNGDMSKDILVATQANSGTSPIRLFPNDAQGIKVSFNTNGGNLIPDAYSMSGTYRIAPDYYLYQNFDIKDVHAFSLNGILNAVMVGGSFWNGTQNENMLLMSQNDNGTLNPIFVYYQPNNLNLSMFNSIEVGDTSYIIAYNEPTNEMVILRGFGDFTPQGEMMVAGSVLDLKVIADFDSDVTGYFADITLSNQQETRVAYHAVGNEIYTYVTNTVSGGNVYAYKFDISTSQYVFLGPIEDTSNNVLAYTQPSGIKVGHFNDDEYMDMVLGEFGSTKKLVLLEGTSNPKVFEPVTIDEGVARYSYLDVADFNQDGKLDIVAVNSDSSTNNQIYLFLQQSDASFVSSRVDQHALKDYSPTTLAYTDIYAVDINLDGYPDIVSRSNSQFNPSMYYLNQKDGTFDTGHYLNNVLVTGGAFLVESMTFGKMLDSDTALSFISGVTDSSQAYDLRDSVEVKRPFGTPSELIIPADPVKANAIFLGWYLDEALTTALPEDYLFTENTTLYASWDNLNVTLTFEDADGNTLGQVYEFAPGSTVTGVTLPTAPTRTGYTFSGWSAAVPNEINEDIVITAQYDVNAYSITFDSKGGTSVDGIEADYNEAITAPSAPTRTGYTFAGWFTDEALTQAFVFNTMPAEDITLYAKWNINNHTITIQNMSEYFTQIFPTYYNFYGITSSNQIFAVGHNLGLGLGDDSGYTYEFTNITSAFDLEDGEYITRIETGDGFTLPVVYFMTSLNRIFVLGTNTDSGNSPQGSLGVEDDTILKVLTPTDITPNFDLANGEYIIDLHGMRFAGIAVSNLGNVYSWGYNEYGNILRDARYTRYHDIADVTSKFTLNSGDKIIGVEGSIHTVIFITEQGKIYGAGWHAYNGTLGQGNTGVQAYTTPIEIVLPLEAGETIQDAQLSLASGLVLTTTGRLIQWSNILLNSGGSTPVVIDILNPNETVVSIHLGNWSGFIITDQRVLTSGANTYGSLGDGTNTSTNTWTDVTSNFQLDGALPLSILTANQVTYALSESKTVYVNGYNYLFSDYATGAVLVPSPISMPEFEVTIFDFDYNADLTGFELEDQGSLFFRGLFYDAEFTQPFDLTNMPDNDLVLYAKFSALLEYDMSNVRWDYDLAYIYDGTTFSVTIDESTLPEGVTVASYTFNQATNAGTYTATVTFNYDEALYFEPTFDSLTWTIEKANYDFNDVQWADGIYTYDGNPVDMTLLNLPEGVTAVYTNGSATNAGTYTTSVTFEYDDDNYNEPSFNDATWIIEKANYDFSNVRWADGVYTYDGNQVNMTLLNLPAGVTPIYTNGSATNAGTYTTSVTFEYDEDNYNQPDFNEATWIIQKGNYDFTNTTWSISNLTYNGLSQSVVLNNIPSGLTPTYTNNTFTNVGTYTATVTFEYDIDNYNEPTFTDNIWQILKANYDYTAVTWDTSLFSYNGLEQTITITNLPQGVTAIYENNTQTNAGTYTVSATFIYDSENYNEPEIASFDWVIEKANYDFSAVSWDTSVLTYNGSTQMVSVTGLPAGVTPNYVNNTAINAGTYTASVTFNYDTANYNEPTFTDNIFIIEKAYYDFSTVSWSTSTVVYDETLQTVEVIGLPQGVTPVYANNTATNAGTYTVSVSFEYDENNYHEPSFTDNIWVVLKGNHDFTNVRWNYTEAVRETYAPIELTVLNLPTGVTPIYTNNVQTNPGVYVASVKFEYDEANYNEPIFDPITWEILKLYYITYQVEGIEIKQAYVDGETITLPETPIKEGFTFLRWIGTLPTTMSAQDLTILGQFMVNQYTIHFLNQDGSVVETWTRDFGTSLNTYYVPTRDSLVFSGFSQVIPSTMPSQDLMIEVYWTNIKDTQDNKSLVSIDDINAVIEPELIENKDVRVTFSIEIKDDSALNDSERQTINDYLRRNQTSVILDIRVLIKETEKSPVVVKELTTTTSVTISIPYELRNQKGLHLVRLVNGEIETVAFTLDQENQTITFETASFTGLSLVYETPNTYEWLWWGVVIIPLGIATYGLFRILIIVFKKDEEDEEENTVTNK